MRTGQRRHDGRSCQPQRRTARPRPPCHRGSARAADALEARRHLLPVPDAWRPRPLRSASRTSRRSGADTGSRSPTRWPSSTSTSRRRRYGQVVGWCPMPNTRRRAAPPRLERLQLGAVPEQRPPARRAPLPAHDGAALEPDPLRGRQGRPRAPRGSPRSSSRTSTSARPATAGRTPRTAVRRASTSPTSARPSATRGPAGSRCSTTTPSRSRARGRPTAVRSTWRTTSGGTSTTTSSSPASGAPRR